MVEIVQRGDENIVEVDQYAATPGGFTGIPFATNNSTIEVSGSSNRTTVAQSVNATGSSSELNSSHLNIVGSGNIASVTQSAGP